MVLQHFLPKLPTVLIGVVAAIIATTVFSLEAKGVAVVGVLLRGLPSFTIPRVGWSDVLPLIGGALGIALVALADTISSRPLSLSARARKSTPRWWGWEPPTWLPVCSRASL
jgi:MFS superfamily sulfate permease-like transporter